MFSVKESLMKWYEAVVNEKDVGKRLDKYLKDNLSIPFDGIQRLIRKRLVRIDGGKACAADRLNAGQSVSLPMLLISDREADSPRQDPCLAQKLLSLIIHENSELIVINKPGGLPVQSGSKVGLCLDDMLTSYNEQYNVSLKLVHRLDKPASGALVVAKGRKPASALTRFFKEKAVRKLYWAIIEGVPKEIEGIIDIPIAKKLVGSKELMVEDRGSLGLQATTKFKVLQILDNSRTWLALEPITGRTHQLRIHCAAMGMPIVGDLKYGSKTKMPICLHSRRISASGWFDVLAKAPSHFMINSEAKDSDSFI
ncbi:MAG: RluA family pseudouridine synthase [Holosporales bacterium]|jgi:23S rRNA pseudouridine955/2504/2580 synthase|nr:RluA family pseudouridine synthase [Holosporales bacterium]